MTTILLALATCLNAAIDLRGVELYSKQPVRFGRWEIRMKAAAVPGTVSSFFTYYNDSYLDAPKPWREIDIEILGNSPQHFQSNLITGTASDKQTSEDVHTNGTSLSEAFHTYTLDWTPDSVVWRLDGQTVRKTSAPDQQVVDLRDSTQTYRMNLWASKTASWTGRLDTNKLPVLQIVNWMIYSTYTPGSGVGGSNFTPAWTDSFTTLNKTRWALGNWTFDQNYATFSSANCKVKDGHLLMMLSTAETEGAFPATFLHDTESSIPVSPKAPSKGVRMTRRGDGMWHAEGNATLLEAFDLRGDLVSRGAPVGKGQVLDLGSHANAVLIVRQGNLSTRLVPGAMDAATLR